ncbi:MFS transporter [Saliterribacillus persicus]|uniref:YQGE family putative transporter n=1 Tax=Saliterribacillus persicus TaxID=930114 RepID=A0A368XCC7_9BACI|nr:MFS transporter [Saliterribacillus persicus]RCW65359.1 YQGE family putative transporter [Saliterribacillus persicus]
MLLILKKNQTERDLYLLLLVGCFYFVGTFLSNTFVNVLLWKQSESFLTIAYYNLSIYFMQLLSFYYAGILAKKIDRTILLRLGVIFLAVFYLSVLLLAEQSSQYSIVLGMLLGVGAGFYWLSYNVLTFEITEPETRDFFNGVLGSMQSFAGMIGPFLAGYIISKLNNSTGYFVIFSISFIMFLLAIFLTWYIQKRRVSGKFKIREIFIEKKQNQNWNIVLVSHFLQGFREGVFLFAISIWVFRISDSELSLGLFHFILSGTSFVIYILVTKKIKYHNRKKMILIGGILIYLSTTILIFADNFLLLLFYAGIIGLSYPLFTVPYISMTYDVIGKARSAKAFRIEYLVVREMFLNSGRIISILIFIGMVYLTDAIKTMPVLFLILGLGHTIVAFLMQKIRLD